MKLFVDTSVLIAACGSAAGASREIFDRLETNPWILIATSYVVSETEKNLHHLPPVAREVWRRLQADLNLIEDVFAIDRPAVFGPAKDRPILFSALASADVLLTLDRQDFGPLLDTTSYGLRVMKPGTFLRIERETHRLR